MMSQRLEDAAMTTRARLIRSMLVLPLALLLAGCWTSERPLIDTSRAAQLPIQGTYRSEDPAETDTIRVTESGDGGYMFDDGDGGRPWFFAALRDRWVIAQWQMGKPGEKGGDGFLYMLMQVGDDRLTMHGVPCDESLDGIAGIERKDTTCTFTSFAAIEQAARKTIGDIESGKIKDGTTVMLRQR
jgi:hypothetical protein